MGWVEAARTMGITPYALPGEFAFVFLLRSANGGIKNMKGELLCGATIGGRPDRRGCMGKVAPGKKGCGIKEHNKKQRKFPLPFERCVVIPGQKSNNKGKHDTFFTEAILNEDEICEKDVNAAETEKFSYGAALKFVKEVPVRWAAAQERGNDFYGEGEEEAGEDEEEGTDDPIGDYLGVNDPAEWTGSVGVRNMKIPTLALPELDTEAPEAPVSVESMRKMSTVLTELINLVEKTIESIPREGELLATFLRKAFGELISDAEAIGDMDELSSRLGKRTLVAGLVHVAAIADQVGADARDAQERVEEALVGLNDVEQGGRDNVAAMGRPLLMALQEVRERVTKLEDGTSSGGSSGGGGSGAGGGGGPPSYLGLGLTTPIMDGAGGMKCTIGSLCDRLDALEVEVKGKEVRIKQLEAAILAQGGVKVGERTFASIQELITLFNTELPSHKALAAFVDPVSFFAFDDRSESAKDWSKKTKPLLHAGRSTAECKYVASFAELYPHIFVEHKTIETGDKAEAFKSIAHWAGCDGRKGAKDRIEESIVRAAKKARSYVSEVLPAGSKLLELAEYMIKRCDTFYTKLFTHFDQEMKKLTEAGLSEDEALILTTDQFLLVFDRIADPRGSVTEFTISSDLEIWLPRAVWQVLLVHKTLDEVLRHHLRQHPSIAAAFVRALTNKMGSKSAAGSMKSLDEKIKSAEKAADAAKKAAEAARQTADKAGSKAEEAKKSADGTRRTCDELAKKVKK